MKYVFNNLNISGVQEAFYRIHTLDGSLVLPPVGVNLCSRDRKWFKSISRANMSPQEVQFTLLVALILPKTKLSC